MTYVAAASLFGFRGGFGLGLQNTPFLLHLPQINVLWFMVHYEVYDDFVFSLAFAHRV